MFLYTSLEASESFHLLIGVVKSPLYLVLIPRSTQVKTKTHTGCYPGPRNALRLGPSFTKLLRLRKGQGWGVAFLLWYLHSGSKFEAESKKNLNLLPEDNF